MVAKVRLTPGGHATTASFVGQLVATLAAVLLVALVAAQHDPAAGQAGRRR